MNPAWRQVDRIIAERLTTPRGQEVRPRDVCMQQGHESGGRWMCEGRQSATGAEDGGTSLTCGLYIQVPQVLVKWRQLGYDLATWETLPDLSKVDGAEAELERFHALHPIADEAEHVQKVLLFSKRMCLGRS